MGKVTCYDFEGNPYEIEESELIKRTSAYGIYTKDGQVLLTRDADRDRWDLPGGGLEKDENLEEGLRREFEEETGLVITGEVKLFKSTQEYYWANRGEAWDSNRNYFIVESASGELITQVNRLGTAEARWIDLKALDDYHIKPVIKSLIKESVVFLVS